MTRSGVAWIAALVASILMSSGVEAADLATTRNRAIVWLERNQNADGSWSAGPRRWTATSEAVHALAKAGRASTVAARRGQGWLLHNDSRAIDSKARSIRALHASGLYVRVLANDVYAMGVGKTGWGVVKGAGTNSYDTALALAAIRLAGIAFTSENGLNQKLAEVLARRRSDLGWSGDDVTYSSERSEGTTTAEIARAYATAATSCADLLATPPFYPPPFSTMYLAVASANNPVVSSTPSLEIAARLAAQHACGTSDSGLEVALLSDARLTNGVWSSSDPLANAIGLLALVTKPGTAAPTCSSDSDGDLVTDCNDAFPNDPDESVDSDHDGVPESIDPDRDGDGVPNGDDAFPDRPDETADLDGDGDGNHEDLDDDGDGIDDLDEYAAGMDPEGIDSDGDLFADGAGGVFATAKLANGWDLDHDGKIDGESDYSTDPTDPLDHPGKGGDLAPLGLPDATIEPRDAAVFLRILDDETVLDGLSGQNRQIAEEALDANRDGRVDAGDGASVLERALQNP